MGVLVDIVKKEATNLMELLPFYFDPAEYPSTDFSSNSTKMFLTRGVLAFFKDCNRKDLPEDAKVPFLGIMLRLAESQKYYKRAFDTTAGDTLSKEKPTQSVSIKSTSVSYGQSEYELAQASAKAHYDAEKEAIRQDWASLVSTYRKLRW